MFNQVGIVAINLLGNESGGRDASNQLSLGNGMDNGSHGGPSVGPGSNNALNDLSIDMNLDPQTANKLRLLSETKSRAIATEDYLTAKQIKAVEGELKSLGSRLAQLDMAKRQAVGAEDYDRAKEIKDETDELRSDIERKILAIHIPGVTDNFPQINLNNQYKQGNQGNMMMDNDDRYNNQDDRSIPVKRERTPERLQKPRFAPSKEDGDEDPFESIDTSPNSNVRRVGGQPKGVPLNIDDIPVGAGAKQGSDGGNNNNDMSSSRKKTSNDTAVTYKDRGIASEPTEYLPNGDRAIKPKQQHGYEDMDPNDPDDNGNGGGGIPDRFQEDEIFAEGAHPLEGVPNLNDLPTPEPLVGTAKDASETNGVSNLCGEYVARCLFSKTWALREAAITKIHMNLEADYEETPGITTCINALATVIKVGVEDKIQQVLFNAVALMDDVLGASRRAKMGRSVLAPILDPITANLVDKLADGNARIREGARRGCDILAASANIGPAVVGAHSLRTMSSKQKTAWRPVVARLQLLTDLINQYGLGNSSGIMVENVMNFAKSNGCFTHSNGEVRIATQELTVAVQKVVGTQAIESYLKLLRPKQLEEYENAFGGGAANKLHPESLPSSQPKRGGAGVSGGSGAKDGSHSPRNTKHAPKTHHSPQKKGVNTNDSDEIQDFTTCMFCGVQNSNWDEDALDMHYWKECALLSPCPSCAQVVEVAGMADHLLDECDQKSKYIACETTGLAIKKSDLKEWQSSSLCKPCATGNLNCALCKSEIENTDDAWRQHLFFDCRENSRSHVGK